MSLIEDLSKDETRLMKSVEKAPLGLENLWSTTVKNRVMIGELSEENGLLNEEEEVNFKCQKGSWL